MSGGHTIAAGGHVSAHLFNDATAAAEVPIDDAAYLLDYTDFSLVRSTVAWEPIRDSVGFLRPYLPNVIRPHATRAHFYNFETGLRHYLGADNVRGLMTRSFNESGFTAGWTVTNCTPEWFSLIASAWTASPERDPVGDQAVECTATANGDATLVRSLGSLGTTKVVMSVYVKIAAGQVAPAGGVQLIGTTNTGATVVTKNITPTSSWVQHSIVVTPVGVTNTITLKIPSAVAGERVQWALPMVTGPGRDYTGPTVGWPFLNLGGLGPLSDGDNLVVPAASVPAAIRGLGGAWAFKWIPNYDSANSSDTTFFSQGVDYEILWAPSRDQSIRLRGGSGAFPRIRTQALVFSAGDVITVEVSPTTAQVRVSGCSGSGNGLGPASWVADDGAGAAQPYTWTTDRDMWVGDRQPFAGDGYSRGSHAGTGYISEPYTIDVF